MNNSDEVLTTAYTSLGAMRAAYQAFERADPMSPEARPLWHEALKIMGKAVSAQWAYTDILMRDCSRVTASAEQQSPEPK